MKQSGLTQFAVRIEIYGRVFPLKREAESYRAMVDGINKEFGKALILEAINI